MMDEAGMREWFASILTIPNEILSTEPRKA
jgi:hypothetical protein